MNKAYFFILFFISIQLTFANETIESLKNEYLNASTDREKAFAALEISKLFIETNLDSANHYGKEALVLASEVESDSLIAAVYKAIGNVGIYQGNLDIALENYFLARKQFDEQKYPALAQGLLNNIGIIFDRKKEYSKARDYYLKAESYMEKIEDQDLKNTRLSKLYSNIGNTYESEGQANMALEYFAKSQSLARETNDLQQQAIVYSNIGSLYLHESNFSLSESNYLEALSLYEKIGNKQGIARMKMHLGDLYLYSDQTEKAIEVFRESIALGEEIKNPTTVYYSSDGLHRMLAKTEQYEEAYQELLRNKSLNDSLFNVEKAAALERLEIEHDYEEEKIKLEQEKKSRTIWIYSLSIGIGLLIIIFVLLYRNQLGKTKLSALAHDNLELKNKHLSLEKKSLEEKLEFKNKELTTNVMYLMKKTELINVVSDKLLAMRKQFKVENQKAINKIIIDLQKAAEDDVWVEFETHFNQVYSDFYNNLLEACPNLTLNERKLCAFIRLNLTTKEICAITHQSPNTLQVSRTRLRKKLGLESNDQLFNYLQNF